MPDKATFRTAFIILSAFLLAFFVSQRIFQTFPNPPGWKTIITSDGRGYYAYLPAIFLEGDLSFEKTTQYEKKLYGSADYNPVYLVDYHGMKINKYFAGEALLLLPFFLLAMLLTWITGLPMDGFSLFFQLATGLGCLFYLLAGLHFLRKILERLGFTPRIIILVLFTIVFATNLFYYAIWQPSMSHVYSFFSVNGFLWFIIRCRERGNAADFVLSGLFLGFVILIRPVNGLIVLLIPFLCNTSGDLKSLVLNFLKRGYIWFLPALVLILLIQPLVWYSETGRLFLWSYREEGFNFSHPQFLNVLFSFRKGLFVYTPILLLSLPGIFLTFRKPRFRPASLVVFLFAITWVISSWWNWYYGDGFGMRPFIDFYGVFCILIAFSVSWPFRAGLKSDSVSRSFRAGLMAGSVSRHFSAGLDAGLIALFTFLNLFQTWQYNNRVIHPAGMNREKYCFVFMKADSSVINCFGGSDELPFRGSDLSKPAIVLENGFEKELAGWNNQPRISRPGLAFNGKFTGFLDSVTEFSAGLNIPADSLGQVPSRYYCIVRLEIDDSTKGASNGAYFVASIDSFDFKHNFWYGFKVNDIPEKNVNTWRSVIYKFNLPEITNPSAVVKMYVWNPRRKTFFLDDFRITFYKGK